MELSLFLPRRTRRHRGEMPEETVRIARNQSELADLEDLVAITNPKEYDFTENEKKTADPDDIYDESVPKLPPFEVHRFGQREGTTEVRGHRKQGPASLRNTQRPDMVDQVAAEANGGLRLDLDPGRRATADLNAEVLFTFSPQNKTCFPPHSSASNYSASFDVASSCLFLVHFPLAECRDRSMGETSWGRNKNGLPIRRKVGD